MPTDPGVLRVLIHSRPASACPICHTLIVDHPGHWAEHARVAIIGLAPDSPLRNDPAAWIEALTAIIHGDDEQAPA